MDIRQYPARRTVNFSKSVMPDPLGDNHPSGEAVADSSAGRPLVSCVIPTYRRAISLDRAISSVLGQTCESIEVIVVDDNEADSDERRTVQAVVDQQADDRVILVRPDRHANGAVARNIGLATAQGAYVGFLDDDDEWAPHKTEVQLRAAAASPSLAGVSCWHTLSREGAIVEYCRQPSTFPAKLDILSRRVALTTDSLLIPRAIIASGLRYDESLRRHQDIQFVLDLLDYGKIEIIPEFLAGVHIDDHSNRPSYSELVEIKHNFFARVARHLDGLSRDDLLRIQRAHGYELVYSAFKGGDMAGVAREVFACGLSWLSIKDLCERALSRRRGRALALRTPREDRHAQVRG